MEIVMRSQGDTAGTYDIYFRSPNGKKCRSRADVARPVGLTPITGKEARMTLLGGKK